MVGGLAEIQFRVEGTRGKAEQTQGLRREPSSTAKGVGLCSVGKEEPLTSDQIYPEHNNIDYNVEDRLLGVWMGEKQNLSKCGTNHVAMVPSGFPLL